MLAASIHIHYPNGRWPRSVLLAVKSYSFPIRRDVGAASLKGRIRQSSFVRTVGIHDPHGGHQSAGLARKHNLFAVGCVLGLIALEGDVIGEADLVASVRSHRCDDCR